MFLGNISRYGYIFPILIYYYFFKSKEFKAEKQVSSLDDTTPLVSISSKKGNDIRPDQYRKG